MPLFTVYKDIFDCISDGSKTIEVRTRLLKGDTAVFQCGRKIIRKKIAGRHEFNLGDGFFEENWKQILPQAESLGSAKRELSDILPNIKNLYAYFLE